MHSAIYTKQARFGARPIIRVGCVLLRALAVLIGNSTANSGNVAPQATSSVDKRFLRSHADGEERSTKATIDLLVDPVKFDAAGSSRAFAKYSFLVLAFNSRMRMAQKAATTARNVDAS
ncbi:hypothetical protein ON010_g17513 [Phytophthora cinnamomi]|nr:hypothetical protein ON010_g17513 [Phytophthora cinnamomi]